MKKRSVKIAGHPTSVSMEEPFWTALKILAEENSESLNVLVERIDSTRGSANLSSALRLYVLQSLQNKLITGSTSG